MTLCRRSRGILLLATCLASVLPENSAASDEKYMPFGFQTGAGNNLNYSSYAAGMVYNNHAQELTITGGTYSNYFKPGESESENPGPDCFVAILHLPHKHPSMPSQISAISEASWVRRRQFGNPNAG